MSQLITGSGKSIANFGAPLHPLSEIKVNKHECGIEVHANAIIEADNAYMSSHFPGFPIFPGVFMIEATLQAVCFALGTFEGTWPQIRTLRSVRFLAPLLPGDEMTLDASIKPSARKTRSYEVAACCSRADGSIAARLKMEFCYGDLVSA